MINNDHHPHRHNDPSHLVLSAHLTRVTKKFRSKYIRVLNELGEDGMSCEIPLVYSGLEEKWILKNP